MRFAEELDIIGTSIPTEPEGIVVMELEPMAFGTTPAVLTDEGALPLHRALRRSAPPQR